MSTRTLLLAGIFALAVTSPISAQSTFPPDSAIQQLLDERASDGRATGIVVGLLEPDGSARVFTAGNAGASRTLDRSSVFEIGSITKVFTRCCSRTWCSAARSRWTIPSRSTCPIP